VHLYLKQSNIRHGIYLVGRFDNDANPCCAVGRTSAVLQAELDAEAKLVAPEYSVTAVVLDTSLPSSMIPKVDRHRSGDKGKGTKGKGPADRQI
jgi:hypothetical protein